MPTEALGSAKEAHRQWPEGRSEQGASKAKDGPSHSCALPREREEHGRLDRAGLSGGALYFLLKQRVVLCIIYYYESHIFCFSRNLAGIRAAEAIDRKGSASGGEDMVGEGVGPIEWSGAFGG